MTVLKHRCAAQGCTREVPVRMLMCRTHWFRVPLHLRNRIWAGYHRGMDADYHERVAQAVAYLKANPERINPRP